MPSAKRFWIALLLVGTNPVALRSAHFHTEIVADVFFSFGVEFVCLFLYFFSKASPRIRTYGAWQREQYYLGTVDRQMMV